MSSQISLDPELVLGVGVDLDLDLGSLFSSLDSSEIKVTLRVMILYLVHQCLNYPAFYTNRAAIHSDFIKIILFVSKSFQFLSQKMPHSN